MSVNHDNALRPDASPLAGDRDLTSHRRDQTDRPDVCAVIVTYNPDPQHLAELIEALAPQASTILMVDNGSREALLDMLMSLTELPNVHIEALGENCGVAHAHNIGIEWARRIAADYVLLLDHDSKPAPDMIDSLTAAERAMHEQGMAVAAVGPVTVDRRTGRFGKFVRMKNGVMRSVSCGESELWLEVDFLISSGTLIHLDVLERIGGVRDEMFIDHVDTDWCFRARAAGLRLFAVCNAHLYHSLGDAIQRIWVGRWRDVHVHSALRDYYGFRNTVIMLRTTPMTTQWRIALLFRLLGFFGYSCLFLPPRAERVKLMLKGICHGIRGRGGKL